MLSNEFQLESYVHITASIYSWLSKSRKQKRKVTESEGSQISLLAHKRCVELAMTSFWFQKPLTILWPLLRWWKIFRFSEVLLTSTFFERSVVIYSHFCLTFKMAVQNRSSNFQFRGIRDRKLGRKQLWLLKKWKSRAFHLQCSTWNASQRTFHPESPTKEPSGWSVVSKRCAVTQPLCNSFVYFHDFKSIRIYHFLIGK